MRVARHGLHQSVMPARRPGWSGLFVMLVTLWAGWPASAAAQTDASGVRAWKPAPSANATDARGKLADFMSRWSFKLSHQMGEPALDARLVSSGSLSAQDQLGMPAQVQWHVSAQTGGNDGKALVRSLGAVNGGHVDLFASVSRFWVGSDSSSRFMTTAAARLARDNASAWHLPHALQERSRRLQLEGGLGWLVRDNVVAGASYRVMSPSTDRLPLMAPGSEEAWDVYVAWLPWWGGAVTLAWVNSASELRQTGLGGLVFSGQIAY